MRKLFESDNKKLAIVLQLKTAGRVPIKIRVFDPMRLNTVFFDTAIVVNNRAEFTVPLPITSEQIIIQVYNPNVGDRPEGQDPSFSVTMERERLKTNLGCFNNDYKTRKFIEFIENFSKRAGYLSAGVDGSDYLSDDGRYTITYLDNIRDMNTHVQDADGQLVPNRNYGKIIPTPLRVHEEMKYMQAAKSRLISWTVPQRVWWGFHEFSHVDKNKNAKDEVEADLQGAIMFYGLGFPRNEAEKGMWEVYKFTPTEQNKRRAEIVHEFFDQLESGKIKKCRS